VSGGKIHVTREVSACWKRKKGGDGNALLSYTHGIKRGMGERKRLDCYGVEDDDGELQINSS